MRMSPNRRKRARKRRSQKIPYSEAACHTWGKMGCPPLLCGMIPLTISKSLCSKCDAELKKYTGLLYLRGYIVALRPALDNKENCCRHTARVKQSIESVLQRKPPPDVLQILLAKIQSFLSRF